MVARIGVGPLTNCVGSGDWIWMRAVATGGELRFGSAGDAGTGDCAEDGSNGTAANTNTAAARRQPATC